MKENIEDILIAILTEQPRLVEIDGKYVAFPPMSLGQSLIVGQVAKMLGIDGAAASINPIGEVLRVIEGNKAMACRYLALRSFRAKNKLHNEREIQERMRLFEGLDNEDIAQLLIVLLTDDEGVHKVIKHYGIDKEQEALAKASRAKDDGGCLSFGGKSIYGQVIDRACERYGWTAEYVIWDISHANLTLQLADKCESIYLSDEELKKARISRDRKIINGDDPANQDQLIAILKGNE